MTNKKIASLFNLLGKVMELQGENPFKIRSYFGAYNTIRRLPDELISLSREELLSIKGIGKNIADKIEEYKKHGKISTLERYLSQTPPGIVELLQIKGLGSKKILSIWKDLEIESPGELLYACEENRLVDLKGFGTKTQEDLRQKLIYYLDAQGKYLFGHVLHEAEELIHLLRSQFDEGKFEFINDIRRQNQIVHSIDIIGTTDGDMVMAFLEDVEFYESGEEQASFKGTTVHYEFVRPEDFEEHLFKGSASSEFLDEWNKRFKHIKMPANEDQLMREAGISFIPPESRERATAIDAFQTPGFSLVRTGDIKGVVHTHSTYSDGANSMSEMAETCRQLGYEYLVISDHSKSAFYANGLREPEVLKQMEEIDSLNQQWSDFRIFKGIESDILYDGQLDYGQEILEKFEVVIASIHSNLKMEEAKATDRIIKAVENPSTRILGHPTGRLLLSRAGYPIDHMAVIDACAEHNVVIELNANPYRLDLDWTWIPYAIEKGTLISINPDAHSTKGIEDIQFGVSAARKALVQSRHCLNTYSLEKFSEWVDNR